MLAERISEAEEEKLTRLDANGRPILDTFPRHKDTFPRHKPFRRCEGHRPEHVIVNGKAVTTECTACGTEMAGLDGDEWIHADGRRSYAVVYVRSRGCHDMSETQGCASVEPSRRG